MATALVGQYRSFMPAGQPMAPPEISGEAGWTM
jgi:hypothetical protein